MKVKKYSGDLVEFDEDKLRNSLRNAKGNENLIDEIIQKIRGELYDGITTKQIYSSAFKMLKSQRNASASRYKMKNAIMELGPSGYPFEKYIGAILDRQGFRTQIGVFVEGHCVTHEVDVVATNTVKQYMVECKYHNTQGRVNDVKVPLYIQSRFQDINTSHKNNNGHNAIFQQGWIFTNTRFSSDAIQYAECIGLKLVSWDYPKNGNLKQLINEARLFPITVLISLTKHEKMSLLERNIVLCKEIFDNPEILTEVGIPKAKHKRILENLEDLCHVD